MGNKLKSFLFNNKRKLIIALSLILTILFCTLPMGLSPVWNGEMPAHRNQYELMADAILDGKLYIDYEADEKLLEMENPYDPEARDKLGVSYHYDHAFYNGRYYMYFGVAPVFLVFIPYKLIMGTSLTTYHATQIFVGAFIIGIFALFELIRKITNSKVSLKLYVLSSIVFSVASTWYCVGAPALYCTAISSGLCMAVWSIYFFIRAVYGEDDENKSIIFATFGSLFGALTFVCRPPIGLINIIVIPLLIKFLKEKKITKKLIFKLFLAALPYFIIGALLMVYNYVRFDNPLEFGQTYQLTVADQHNYGNFWANLDIKKMISNLAVYFFKLPKASSHFPFIKYSGIFYNFLILLVPYLMFILKRFREALKDKRIYGFYIVLLILPIIIMIVEAMYSPVPLERYRTDVYYLMFISLYISIIIIKEIMCSKWVDVVLNCALVLTFIKVILLFLIPNDFNFTSYYYDEIWAFLSSVFGK